MLKRYLRSTYDMSPEDYRKRWGLPADYPMVAPAYAEQRSAMAKRIGLGKGVRRKGA
jgi:predicted transcriptional regulator